jgi:hypothetical protein
MPLPTDFENIFNNGLLRHSAFSTNSLVTTLSTPEYYFHLPQSSVRSFFKAC